LLTSYRLENCPLVVRALNKADEPNHEALRKLKQLAVRKKLAAKKNKTIGKSILGSMIIGDVQVFPIKTDFQIIKSFVSELNRERIYARLGSTVCVQFLDNDPKKLRKISIRTSRNVDVPELLKAAHEGQADKNYGGHERSGGFIASNYSMVNILGKFLDQYFSETDQQVMDFNLSSLDQRV